MIIMLIMNLTVCLLACGEKYYNNNNNNIQLSPEGEVNGGGYIARRKASRYISTALH